VPTYAYRCQANHEFEVVQSIVDDPLTLCPSCGAGVRRVVFPVGIVFKGQGFYKTDSRSSGTGSLTAPKTASPEPAQAAPAAKAEPVAKADVNPAPSGASAGASGTGVKNG
jgi:putative FmdB family regulatory protein